MVELIEANWLAFVLALLIGLMVAFWLFGRASKGAAQREHKPDALDEGAEPAQRNQALIDAPPAAAPAIIPPPQTGAMAGIGEVIAVAAQDEVEVATATAAPPPPAEGDDLRKVKGVGPKLVKLLHSLGITRYDQIAAWTEDDIDRIDAQLGTFAGRIRRDSWTEQAKFLSTGDQSGFEGKFGKL